MRRRNEFEGHARADGEFVGTLRKRHNRVAFFQTVGSDDVALRLLFVLVLNEGDVRRAVRVVLNRHYSGGYVHDVALEVYNAVQLLVSAADVMRP